MRKSHETVELSIIVPTYQAKALAQRSAEALHEYLGGQGLSFEVVLVDDGSDPEQRPDPLRLPAEARVVQLPVNRGKGSAVRTGLLDARGRCRIFTDVDLPYGLDSLMRCHDAIASGADFVYGDRSLPASTVVAHPSWRRRLSSVVFRSAVSTLAGLRPTDTQCGLKGFDGAVADALAPLLQTDHFAFDVEIFRCALDNGLEGRPIPVQLVNGDVSTVRLLRDSMTMFRDLITIRRRAMGGNYRSAAVTSAKRTENGKARAARLRGAAG